MKNSKGEHLPNETVKACLSNNTTEADTQKINTWEKDVKAEDIDKMTDDLGRIASAKICSLTYGAISKATANMDSGKAIEFYHKIMNSPEYKSQTEEMKKQRTVAMDEGEGVEVDYASDNISDTASIDKKIDIKDNTENQANIDVETNINKQDVFNNTDATLSNEGSKDIDTDNGLSENNQFSNDTAGNAETSTSNVNSEGIYGSEGNNSSQGIANGDER